MFSLPPSSKRENEESISEALEVAELLQRYFRHLSPPDLMSAGQVNSQWSNNVNPVLASRLSDDGFNFENSEDMKLWLQLMDVAPAFTMHVLRGIHGSLALTDAAKESLDVIRQAAEKLKVSNADIIKEIATNDRCSYFTHVRNDDLHMLIDTAFYISDPFKLNYKTAARIVHTIHASNMSFPLILISTNLFLMAKLEKFAEHHKLSFMDAYIVLYGLLSDNSSFFRDKPIKDCEIAIEYLDANPSQWREKLAGIKKTMQEHLSCEDLSECLANMDNKAFDCFLAQTILCNHKGDNKELVTAVADIATSRQENILITLRTVMDLIRKNPGISNQDILSSLKETSKLSPK